MTLLGISGIPTERSRKGLPTAHCQLPTANCQLPTANWLLATANCQLATANWLLPTAYCLLPTAYCLLPSISWSRSVWRRSVSESISKSRWSYRIIRDVRVAISSGARATLGSSLIDSAAGVVSVMDGFAMDSISMVPESAKRLSKFSSQFRFQIDANADR